MVCANQHKASSKLSVKSLAFFPATCHQLEATVVQRSFNLDEERNFSPDCELFLIIESTRPLTSSIFSPSGLDVFHKLTGLCICLCSEISWYSDNVLTIFVCMNPNLDFQVYSAVHSLCIIFTHDLYSFPRLPYWHRWGNTQWL